MAIFVPLSRGLVSIIDDADAERVLARRWHAKPQSKKEPGYYAAGTPSGGRGTIYLHRFITDAPKGAIVDHINGDGLDNRRENLRVGDATLNQINRRYANVCGFRGVGWGKGRYAARLEYRGMAFTSCGYLTAEGAAVAYDELARRFHGDAAILNFPDRVA